MKLKGQTVKNGLIAKAISGFYYVVAEGQTYECHARGIFRKEEQTPLVGDHVRISVEANGAGTVEELLPRKNEFARPPVANVDRLVLVSAVREPAPSLLVLDKLTVACERKGVEPVLVFTKTDLGDPTQLRQTYEKAGFPVVCLSNPAGEKEAFARVREQLQGICVLCGNTGVGKSTLLNNIFPELSLETAQISKKLGRGKHTTRHVELYPLPDGAGYAADTPGFGALDLTGREFIRKEELALCFREFAPYLEGCRFTGCSHTAEKGCAVLQAVEEGEIPRSRWESYRTLYDEAKQIPDWQLK